MSGMYDGSQPFMFVCLHSNANYEDYNIQYVTLLVSDTILSALKILAHLHLKAILTYYLFSFIEKETQAYRG